MLSNGRDSRNGEIILSLIDLGPRTLRPNVGDNGDAMEVSDGDGGAFGDVGAFKS